MIEEGFLAAQTSLGMTGWAAGLMEWVEEKYGSEDPQLHGWGC